MVQPLSWKYLTWFHSYSQVLWWSVWPDLAIDWTLGNFLKPLATINFPKSPTVLGNFCVGAKIFNFSSEIIFGQLLWTFCDFYLVTLAVFLEILKCRSSQFQIGTYLYNEAIHCQIQPRSPSMAMTSLSQDRLTMQKVSYTSSYRGVVSRSNIIEIEGLLFPGFGPMRVLHGKQVFPDFPIKWCHKGDQNFSIKELHFWAPLWCHLMGKTSFPWSACICQNPGIANLLFQ